MAIQHLQAELVGHVKDVTILLVTFIELSHVRGAEMSFATSMYCLRSETSSYDDQTLCFGWI